MALVSLKQAVIGSGDVEADLEFHRVAYGLQEVGRQGETVYLGVAGRESYVVALAGAGGTGVRHFVLDADSEEDLEVYAARLSELGVACERRSDDEPGKKVALRFTAPSGHVIELVPRVGDSAAELGGSIAPLGLDHITLRAGNVRELCDFLCSALDCHVSDAVAVPGIPGGWLGAWTRVGDLHHTIAMMTAAPDRPGETLDHLAWRMRDVGHQVQGCDALAALGISLEAGIGRHNVGGNLFAYFQTAGGNRYELSGGMDRVTSPDPVVWDGDGMVNTFSRWGHTPPESFMLGS